MNIISHLYNKSKCDSIPNFLMYISKFNFIKFCTSLNCEFYKGCNKIVNFI